MTRSSFSFWLWIRAGAIALPMIAQSAAFAEWSGDDDERDHRGPVYQRRAFEWMGHHDDRHGRGDDRAPHWTAPQVNAGWFQRPYPYHLDYYKMRYGGSYAPYFGNLYGPPEVVTAPPYYGPYQSGYAYPGDYGQHGQYDGPHIGYPAYPNGVLNEAPVEKAAPKDEADTSSSGEGLPSPAP